MTLIILFASRAVYMELGNLTQQDYELGEIDQAIQITGLTADSREVKPGFLFAAMPGVQFDGAKFIPSAVEKGAVAVLMSSGSDVQVPENVVILRSDNPRQALAKFASRFYQKQPEHCVAVTGTNGKTSVASFLRQIWRYMGYDAASLGTIGLVTKDENVVSSHTTPEPVALHRMLAGLVDDGITHLALEASSHGLQQCRLDGVRLKAGAFTNISRDHLDYHKTFEDYFAQKMRLFSELLPQEATAVIDMDSEGSDQVIKVCEERGLTLLGIGQQGNAIKLVETNRDGYAQVLKIIYQDQNYEVRLPLVGDFQASNALVAAGLCLSLGAEPTQVFTTLERLEGAKGRLEYIAQSPSGAAIFIDYAHTPDALENALKALRPYVDHKLIVLFGCGGDRDKGKRPQMGDVSHNHADIVYVVDDNPRSEDAAQIRKEILVGVPNAIEIGDRAEAIQRAVAQAVEGDVILVAGKGHETGQIIGDTVVPYSDHEAVHEALKSR